MKNKEILLKLLRIKKPLHEKFDFTLFNDTTNGLSTNTKIHNCGSAGCLLGNIPRFDNEVRFGREGMMWTSPIKIFDEQEYFNLSFSLCRVMFYPLTYAEIDGHKIKGLKEDATLKEVQDNIKKIMELVPKYFIEE